MLTSGDYVEGEAIVCYLNRGVGSLYARSDDPLSGAERLSEVTARQYAEARNVILVSAGPCQLGASPGLATLRG